MKGAEVEECGVQVTGATLEGDIVKLTVEPAKGGESETIEADVVLVSAGVFTSWPMICAMFRRKRIKIT